MSTSHVNSLFVAMFLCFSIIFITSLHPATSLVLPKISSFLVSVPCLLTVILSLFCFLELVFWDFSPHPFLHFFFSPFTFSSSPSVRHRASQSPWWSVPCTLLPHTALPPSYDNMLVIWAAPRCAESQAGGLKETEPTWVCTELDLWVQIHTHICTHFLYICDWIMKILWIAFEYIFSSLISSAVRDVFRPHCPFCFYCTCVNGVLLHAVLFKKKICVTSGFTGVSFCSTSWTTQLN